MPPQLEIALLRLYADCHATLIVGQSHSLEAGGIVLRLSVEPPANEPPRPETECEEDVYGAVGVLTSLLGRRVTTKEILAELELVGKIWGRSTILNGLAALVHRGLLTNLRNKKGYALADKFTAYPSFHGLADSL